MHHFGTLVAASLAVVGAAADGFNVLQHLGGNGQWLPGLELTGISSDVPHGCNIDLVASFSRHGSRFPDTGAYNGWVNFAKRLQAANNLTFDDEKLDFLKTWQAPLSDPDRQIAQLSPTGIKELLAMGATWRERYPHLYQANTPFTIWANYYKSSPRVRDTARYFAQGFLGPDAAGLATIYALNASDPLSWKNSLAPSDLCSAYNDEGGSPYKEQWEAIFIPPIRSRLNGMIHGNFSLTESDISQIPYLCGFETQITGRPSPFCSILTKEEILQYEYAQDLRYWYGTGLGSDIEKYQMLPILDMVVDRFIHGPYVVYKSGNSTFNPPKIMASFSNDGQINQLIAALGVFDNEPQLPGDKMLSSRKFRSSLLTPMRGTVAFERLTCKPTPVSACETSSTNKDIYMRIRLNEVVYPVVNCSSGPGSSCPLPEYQKIVKSKLSKAGSFIKMCNTTDLSFSDEARATFLMDNTLPWASVIKP